MSSFKCFSNQFPWGILLENIKPGGQRQLHNEGAKRGGRWHWFPVDKMMFVVLLWSPKQNTWWELNRTFLELGCASADFSCALCGCSGRKGLGRWYEMIEKQIPLHWIYYRVFAVVWQWDSALHPSYCSTISYLIYYYKVSRWLTGKEPACQCRRPGFHPWVRKIPWRRKWQPTPVFLPGKSHGQRSLVGYSPRSCKRVSQDLVTKQQQYFKWIHVKNWCFWTVVLEKTLESSLDCKEIQPVHPKGNQSWIFIGRADANTETLILWPHDGKNWLIWKDPEAGKDWRREKKGITEDEMAGWHHRLNECEFE